MKSYTKYTTRSSAVAVIPIVLHMTYGIATDRCLK